MRDARWEDCSCLVLDAGSHEVDERELARAVGEVAAGRATELARDRNAVAYRLRLATRDRRSCPAVVKVARDWSERTNPDTTFATEARVLRALPDAGIGGGPRLLARVLAGGRHYLFMAEVQGEHPHPGTRPLDAGTLTAIADLLFEMDVKGLMHYDLKLSNVLVDDARVSFVDYEFARFHVWDDAYGKAGAAFCRDFNVSPNPIVPSRSNVANFEFRALHHYLDESARLSPGAEWEVLRLWLHAKSRYHQRMADRLRGAGKSEALRFAPARGTVVAGALERLRRGARHESLLARLFRQSGDRVVRIERLLIAYRCAVFERHRSDVERLQRAVRSDLDAVTAQGDGLPAAYRNGVVRVLTFVAQATA